MTSHAPDQARVIPLRPAAEAPAPAVREPLWRDVVGDVLRRERLGQERTLKDVADAARISMPYLSEVERGRKEASSEVLAAAAQALGLGLAGLLDLARGELARIAGTRGPVRTAGAPAAPGRGTGTERPAAADGDDRGAASATELSAARATGARTSPAPHRGEVRLAA